MAENYISIQSILFKVSYDIWYTLYTIGIKYMKTMFRSRTWFESIIVHPKICQNNIVQFIIIQKRYNCMPFLFVHKICPVPCLQIFRFVSRLNGDDDRIVVSLSEYQCKIYLPIYYNVSNLPLKMLCSTRESLFIRVQT